MNLYVLVNTMSQISYIYSHRQNYRKKRIGFARRATVVAFFYSVGDLWWFSYFMLPQFG